MGRRRLPAQQSGPGFGNSYSQSVPNPGGNFSLRSVQPGSEGRVGRMARDMLNR
jgi:hypothetical protein